MALRPGVGHASVCDAGSAMRAGLIDEFTLVTHPVLVGDGKRFFAPLDTWVNLHLEDVRTFPEGIVVSRYTTRPS